MSPKQPVSKNVKIHTKTKCVIVLNTDRADNPIAHFMNNHKIHAPEYVQTDQFNDFFTLNN